MKIRHEGELWHDMDQRIPKELVDTLEHGYGYTREEARKLVIETMRSLSEKKEELYISSEPEKFLKIVSDEVLMQAWMQRQQRVMGEYAGMLDTLGLDTTPEDEKTWKEIVWMLYNVANGNENMLKKTFDDNAEALRETIWYVQNVLSETREPIPIVSVLDALKILLYRFSREKEKSIEKGEIDLSDLWSQCITELQTHVETNIDMEIAKGMAINGLLGGTFGQTPTHTISPGMERAIQAHTDQMVTTQETISRVRADKGKKNDDRKYEKN